MKTTNIQATKLLIIEDLIDINDVDVLSSIRRHIRGKREKSVSPPAAISEEQLWAVLKSQEESSAYIANDQVLKMVENAIR